MTIRAYEIIVNIGIVDYTPSYVDNSLKWQKVDMFSNMLID